MTLLVSINTLIKLYMNNTARDCLQATIKKIEWPTPHLRSGPINQTLRIS